MFGPAGPVWLVAEAWATPRAKSSAAAPRTAKLRMDILLLGFVGLALGGVRVGRLPSLRVDVRAGRAGLVGRRSLGDAESQEQRRGAENSKVTHGHSPSGVRWISAGRRSCRPTAKPASRCSGRPGRSGWSPKPGRRREPRAAPQRREQQSYAWTFSFWGSLD